MERCPERLISPNIEQAQFGEALSSEFQFRFCFQIVMEISQWTQRTSKENLELS